jgi:nitrate reductase gamma subunit
MSGLDLLVLGRGPLFRVALLVFLGGMAYRIVRVSLLGWSRDRVPSKGSKAFGTAVAYLKAALVWPFVPWVKNTFRRRPTIYLAGGLFHLGLFAIIFFGTPHMLVWKSLLGVGWWTLPLPVVDWLAAATLVAMGALLVNRLMDPVLRLITGASDWLNWAVVFLPVLTGYLTTHHVVSPYELIFGVHVISVDLMLIWIPFSRISHFVFYFYAKTIHGAQFGKRAVTP